MNSDWQPIAEALRHEIAEYGGLLNLFEDQQRCIFQRDAEGILAINLGIEAQVSTLQDCRRAREQAVAAFAEARGQARTSTLRSLLPLFLAEVRPLLEALIDQVNVLIHRVRRVSRHNQALLARSIEAQQQLMRTLRPGSFSPTYAPNGRVALAAPRPAPAIQVAR